MAPGAQPRAGGGGRRLFASMSALRGPFPSVRASSVMSTVIESLERAQLRRVPNFQAGDRVRVHFQVIEGTRRRTQVFEGVVIKRQGHGARETFTVRKQSSASAWSARSPCTRPRSRRSTSPPAVTSAARSSTTCASGSASAPASASAATPGRRRPSSRACFTIRPPRWRLRPPPSRRPPTPRAPPSRRRRDRRSRDDVRAAARRRGGRRRRRRRGQRRQGVSSSNGRRKRGAGARSSSSSSSSRSPSVSPWPSRPSWSSRTRSRASRWSRRSQIGQRVLVNRVGYHFGDPHVGEVIVFHPPVGAESGVCGDTNRKQGQACDRPPRRRAGINYIKRVVGLPGDRISVRSGHVYRNGKREPDAYITARARGGTGLQLHDADHDPGGPLLHDGRQPWRLSGQPLLGPRPAQLDHRRRVRDVLAGPPHGLL